MTGVSVKVNDAVNAKRRGCNQSTSCCMCCIISIVDSLFVLSPPSYGILPSGHLSSRLAACPAVESRLPGVSTPAQAASKRANPSARTVPPHRLGDRRRRRMSTAICIRLQAESGEQESGTSPDVAHGACGDFRASWKVLGGRFGGMEARYVLEVSD